MPQPQLFDTGPEADDLPDEAADWVAARIIDALDLLPDGHPARAHLDLAFRAVCRHPFVDGDRAAHPGAQCYAVCEDCGAELGTNGWDVAL